MPSKENLKSEIRDLSTIFSSKSFLAIVQVLGYNEDGSRFDFDFALDHNDPEFKKMINDLGARKSVELLTVKTEI